MNTTHSLHDVKIARQMAHIFNVITVMAINEDMRCIVDNQTSSFVCKITHTHQYSQWKWIEITKVRTECDVSGYSIDAAKQQLLNVLPCPLYLCHIATQTIFRIAFWFSQKINNFYYCHECFLCIFIGSNFIRTMLLVWKSASVCVFAWQKYTTNIVNKMKRNATW